MTTCFVIGPIGNELAPLGSAARISWESSLEIYERVIRAACEFLDIEAVRADQISITGDITEQIFRHLFEADLVIADLTGANANVMYELGLRHSLRKLTIQVADIATPLPFDVNAVRTIMIDRSQLGLVEARKRLVAAIETGLTGKADMVAATRVWDALANADSGDVGVILGDPDESESTEAEAADEDGFIEILLSLGDSFGKVTQSLVRVGGALATMNEETARASAELSSVDPGASNAVRLGYIRKFADLLQGHGSELETLTLAYQADIEALDSRVSPLLRMLASDPQLREAAGAEGFLDTILTLAVAARDAFDGFGGFATSLKTLGAMSSMLRGPAKSISASVARLADSITIIDDWDAAVRRIKEQDRLGPV